VPPAGLMRWHAALAGRTSAPAKVVVVGDSISEGQGATAKSNRWVEKFQANLRSYYGVTGGEGYSEAAFLQNSFPSPWSAGGNVTANYTFGYGQRCAVLRSPDGYIQRTVTGSSVVISYLKNTSLGSFSVFVDGSSTAALTVNTATGATSSTAGGGRATVTFSAAGSHTVQLKWASGGDVYIPGMWIYNGDENSGIHVTDSAKYGSATHDWTPTTSNTDTAHILGDELKVDQPDLVILEIGANDRTQEVTSSIYATNLATIVNELLTSQTLPPSVLLVAAYNEGTANEAWQNYIDVQKSLVGQNPNNLAHFDLSTRMPTATTATSAWGLFASDGVHPSDRGHALIADYVTNYLLSR
jgi:lysophospholipase L1-like esterase